MPNTNRRHLKKIYCLEFLDTCKKMSQHLNALSLRFFFLFDFFFPSGEQSLQESQLKVRFEKFPLLTTLLVIQCTGGFMLPSLLVRTQICCFPRTWMNRSIIPANSGMDCRPESRPLPASGPCHNLSLLTALFFLLAGKRSLNSEKLLKKLVNFTS